MSFLRLLRGGARRRWGVIGLAASVAAAGAIAAGALARSAPSSPPGPEVLHPAPALVRPGRPVTLSAAVVCSPQEDPACQVAGALAHVRARDAEDWIDVAGTLSGGGYQFTVPPETVTADGFDYWLEFRTQDGGSFAYPSGGALDPLSVLTTAGLPDTAVPDGFSWANLARPVRRVLFLRYGTQPGEVGRWGGPGRDRLGPSSFAVAPDGSISVVDWVNDRLETFSSGRLVRTVPLPVHRTLDVAIGAEGSVDLLTLGTGGTVYEISSADGWVLGRYPVDAGVPSRVDAGPAGPFVSVGPAQWVPVRAARGVALSGRLQQLRMTEAPPLPSGEAFVSDVVGDGAIAAVWMNVDGTAGGAVVHLPPGVRAGGEYFGNPLPDGGAEMARGLWDDQHFAVGLFRLDAAGNLVSFSIIPEPSTQMDARSSTVRLSPSGEVLAAYDEPGGVAIDAFEVAR